MVMISVNFIPTDREAQLYPQALGVHLFAFYEPYELMVGLFLSGHHTDDKFIHIVIVSYIVVENLVIFYISYVWVK